jgi:hypothetical protein
MSDKEFKNPLLKMTKDFKEDSNKLLSEVRNQVKIWMRMSGTWMRNSRILRFWRKKKNQKC